MQKPVKTQILGVGVTGEAEEEVLEYVLFQAKKQGEKCSIVTPNPEIVVYANQHPKFREILNKADVALCDGVGLFLASKIMRKPVKERITGVDFMKNLCEKSVKNGLSIGFLGGRHGVAEEASKCLKELYPGLNVVFTAEEWPESFARQKRLKSKDVGFKNKKENLINLPQIDILFVAYGFPKQEEWIVTHLPKIPVTVAMGVGGAFDYLSGRVPRAPRIVRTMGMEWLYRLAVQPWRWKRQLNLFKFVALVIAGPHKVQ